MSNPPPPDKESNVPTAVVDDDDPTMALPYSKWSPCLNKGSSEYQEQLVLTEPKDPPKSKGDIKTPDVPFTLQACRDKELVTPPENPNAKKVPDKDGIIWKTKKHGFLKAHSEVRALIPEECMLIDGQPMTQLDNQKREKWTNAITPGHADHNPVFVQMVDHPRYSNKQLLKKTTKESTGLGYYRKVLLQGNSEEANYMKKQGCFKPCSGGADYSCLCGGIAAAGANGLHEGNDALSFECCLGVCGPINNFKILLDSYTEEDIKSPKGYKLLTCFCQTFVATKNELFVGKYTVRNGPDMALTKKNNSKGNPPGLVPFCLDEIGYLVGEEKFSVFVSACLVAPAAKEDEKPCRICPNKNPIVLAPCMLYNYHYKVNGTILEVRFFNFVVEVMIHLKKSVFPDGLPEWPHDAHEPNLVLQYWFAGTINGETPSWLVSYSSLYNCLKNAKKLLGMGSSEGGETYHKQVNGQHKIAVAACRLQYSCHYLAGMRVPGVMLNWKGMECLTMPDLSSSCSDAEDSNNGNHPRTLIHSTPLTISGTEWFDDLKPACCKEHQYGLLGCESDVFKFGNTTMTRYSPATDDLWQAVTQGRVDCKVWITEEDEEPIKFHWEFRNQHPLQQLLDGVITSPETMEDCANDIADGIMTDMYLKLLALNGLTTDAQDGVDVHMRSVYIQGKINPKCTSTTAPHLRLSRWKLKEMQDDNTLALTYIMPVCDSGIFIKVYESSSDRKGKVVFVAGGTILCVPMTVPIELGFLTDIRGSPFLLIDVVAKVRPTEAGTLGHDEETKDDTATVDPEETSGQKKLREWLETSPSYDYPHLDKSLSDHLDKDLAAILTNGLLKTEERLLVQKVYRTYSGSDKDNSKKGRGYKNNLAEFFTPHGSEADHVHCYYCF